MKIDKKQIEDVEPVEEITDVQEEREPTPEEKEQMDKFLRSSVIRKFRYTLQTIDKRCKETGLDIEGLIEEVNAKISPLSKSQRDFLIGFKSDFIKQLIDDMHESARLAVERKYAVQS